MIISAKVIQKPRVPRKCWRCEQEMFNGPILRLYGAALAGDPPYVVYEHPDCVPDLSEPKIAAAMKGLE